MGVVGVSADHAMLAHWSRLVGATCEHIVSVPLLANTPVVDHWVVVLGRQEPLTYLFWLHTLNAPITLIAPSINAAQPLLDRVPLIRVLCHTSRALVSLADVLAMSEQIFAGSLVLNALPSLKAQINNDRRGYVRN